MEKNIKYILIIVKIPIINLLHVAITNIIVFENMFSIIKNL